MSTIAANPTASFDALRPLSPVPDPLAAAVTDLATALQTLHLVAVETLTRLLRTESDPKELRRLLAIAFKGPKLPAESRTSPDRTRRLSEEASPRPVANSESAPTKTAPKGEAADPTPAAATRADALQLASPVASPPQTDKPAPPLTTQHSPPAASPDSSLTAHIYTPMSDTEYLALTREIGLVEAGRRRAIRAHLAAQHAQSKDNAQHDEKDADDSS